MFSYDLKRDFEGEKQLEPLTPARPFERNRSCETLKQNVQVEKLQIIIESFVLCTKVHSTEIFQVYNSHFASIEKYSDGGFCRMVFFKSYGSLDIK